jgi:putative FmdB family regulatory protein
MPLYEYQCESCGVTFEVIQKFSDHSVDTCRTCGGKVRRLLSAPAIQFKGTGWYITDYARKGKTDPEAAAASKPSADTSAPTSKTETSTDSKSPSPAASTSGSSSGSTSTSTSGATPSSTTSTSEKK